jgi:hemoglobin-like flavoprotein
MDIQKSLDEILCAKDKVGQAFYERLLKKHPEVAPLFAKVDLGRQGVLLTTALMIIVRHYREPTEAVELYLRYLGTKHKEIKIPQSEYTKWTDVLMETLSEFHGETWSADVEKQWREAIRMTAELMFSGYEQRITV